MKSFKKIGIPTLTLLALAGVACGQAAPAPVNPTAPAAAPADGAAAGGVDAVLDQLDQRGQTLESFTADVALLERDDTTALESTRVGKVWYQKLPDGSARMRVAFTDRLDAKNKRADPVDFVLEGGRLIERQHAKKLEIRRQILRPGEKANLLKLGEGPFPMPIGQKKEEVKKQFDVTSVKPDKEDPAGTSHVMLRPREGTSLKRKINLIDVWMDQKTQMPVKVETLDNKETTVKSTTLTSVQINPKLKDEDFKLPAIDETQWNVTIEQFKE